MGKSDVPAALDKIIEVTGNPKVSYVGFSQGTSQLLYGLASQPVNRIADKLDRAVLLAPCVYTPSQGYDGYMKIYPLFRDQGVNYINDPATWSANLLKICQVSPEDGNKIKEGHEYACAIASTF